MACELPDTARTSLAPRSTERHVSEVQEADLVASERRARGRHLKAQDNQFHQEIHTVIFLSVDQRQRLRATLSGDAGRGKSSFISAPSRTHLLPECGTILPTRIQIKGTGALCVKVAY